MNPSVIVGLTGPAGCGKSTVAGILAGHFGFLEESFARPLRSFACTIAGLTPSELERDKERPHPVLCGRSPREFMQQLGTEFGRHLIGEDLWIRALEGRIARYQRFIREQAPQPLKESARDINRLVVSDVRFPNEAAWIRTNGQLWHLTRPGKVVQHHISEAGIQRMPPGYVLDNDCDLDALRQRISELLERT